VTQTYNTLRRSFPTVIVANFAGFKERPYFKAVEGSDKPPAVKF
jgi:LemA protein